METIDDDESNSEISLQVAQGSTDENEPFVTEMALVEYDNVFNKDGFYSHLLAVPVSCENFLNGDVRFFLEANEDLETGTYRADGPFIKSTSFFGCDLVITSVTETTIEGKVKGGNFDGDKYIEGAFVAERCQ